MQSRLDHLCSVLARSCLAAALLLAPVTGAQAVAGAPEVVSAQAVAAAQAAASAPGAASSKADPIPELLAQVSEQRIRARIEKLVSFGTRHTLSDAKSETQGIGAARRWIEADLREASQATGGRLEVRTLVTANERKDHSTPEVVDVYGFLPGKAKDPHGRTYLVSAHYDSRATDVKDSTSAAPGADDDASGTAVVLELARVFAQHEFEANLVFLCVAGEEQGLWGSHDFAAFVQQEKIDLDAAMTNDIVGGVVGGNGVRDDLTVRCFSGGDGLNDPSRELARRAYDAARRYVPEARVQLVFRLDRLKRGGDHIPFHDLKIPALRFTEANEDYHHQHQDVNADAGLGDFPQFVSETYVARVARVNGALLAELASAPPAPTGVEMEGAVRYDTEIRWQPSPGAAGYVVVWRDTTAPVWEHRSNVVTATRAVFPVVADNTFFGVRAVDAAGHESRTAIPPRP
jgi:hypothetical protein